MSLFDAFSTAPANNAAGAQAGYIGQGLQDLIRQVGYGQNALQGAYGTAGSDITTGYQGAFGTAAPLFAQSVNAWNPLTSAANKGVTAYGDATGANGPGGMAQALTNFWSNPGTVAALGAGNAATAATGAATGTTGSGNETLALARQNQGIASGGWNNYVSNLAPYLNFSTNAAQGTSGALNTEATTLGGFQANQGTALSNVNTGLGTQLLGSQTGVGNAMYGANASIGNAYANADLAAYQASANQLGALTGLFGLGASSFGASGMFGNGAGGGALAGVLPFSDEDVKEDIEPIGKTADGQTIYRYRYVGSPVTHMGLIAQEVEQTRPEAVHFDQFGLRHVDYSKATDDAAALLRMATNDEVDPLPYAMGYGSDLMRIAA